MNSWKKPTPEQVNRAISSLGRAGHYRYFFDKLENPEWIEPLELNGFFKNPLKIVKNEADGSIRFPPWPESKYLARMAEHKPRTVIVTIKGIPDNHENPSVYEDFITAILKIPSHILGTSSYENIQPVIAKIKKSIRLKYHHTLPLKLGEIIEYLSKNNQIRAALILTKELLDILPDKVNSQVAKKYGILPQAKARFDEWQYEEILRNNIPSLIKHSGSKGLKILCEKLIKTIKFTRGNADSDDFEDYSYIWRPAIEEIPNEIKSGLKYSLVTSVRDASEQIVKSKLLKLSEVIEFLETFRWKIFYRVAFHILKELGDDCLIEVERVLSKKMFFKDHSMYREYGLLLRKYFYKISTAQQNKIFQWINKGPDKAVIKNNLVQWKGRLPTAKEIEEQVKKWQINKLIWFKDHLNSKWEMYYEKLIEKYGEPKDPEIIEAGTSTWIGPTSPKSDEQLKEMSVDDFLQFLEDWQPEYRNFGPSPEGLGRVISSTLISENPEKFAKVAHKFRKLDPTYVRFYLSGLRESLKKNKSFEWSNSLTLCIWITEQPTKIKGRKIRDELFADPDWSWTRKSIADLLSEGFNESPGEIPFDKREIVWRIIKSLTKDPDPTLEYEARYGGDNMDPATMSINTIRGQAFQALVRYALWVRRHLEKLPDSNERLNKGFVEISEVRDLLELHLDVSVEPTLTIRSVYGQWFPWLVLMDAEWAKRNVNKIFPLIKEQLELRNAAWNTYITFCAPYDNVFNVLEKQYFYSLHNLGSKKAKRLLVDPDKRLVEHIVTFYWRDKINIDKDKNLISEFWKFSSPELKAHAIEFIGRRTMDTPVKIPTTILERFKIYLKIRLEKAKSKADNGNYKIELKPFGWWFVSDKFERKWIILQLLEIFKISEEIEPDYLVIEKLINYVDEYPKETIKSLSYLLKNEEKKWRVIYRKENAKQILQKALNTTAKHDAEQLIHYLGSKGYYEFGELLR